MKYLRHSTITLRRCATIGKQCRHIFFPKYYIEHFSNEILLQSFQLQNILYSTYQLHIFITRLSLIFNIVK